MRGKHQNHPNAVKHSTEALIEAHIRKFPYRVAHYSTVAKKRRYLSSTKMYELFLKENDPGSYAEFVAKKVKLDKVRSVVSYRGYLKYFRDVFNYGFGRPQVDKCRECEELKVKIQGEKNAAVRQNLVTTQWLHKLKAKSFYDEIKRCTELAEQCEDTEMITFDYQQNIPVPVTNVTDEFYLRQLWVYNFGVHRMTDNKQVMYMYSEVNGKKACSEVVSFIKHFIDHYIPKSVRKLYVFSDG